MTDIVERLRASIRDLASGDWGTPKGLLIAEAACEIERLRAGIAFAKSDVIKARDTLDTAIERLINVEIGKL